MPAHSRTQLRFPGWGVESTDGWVAIIAEQSSLCLGFREGKVDLSPGEGDGGSRWEGGSRQAGAGGRANFINHGTFLGGQRSKAREGGERVQAAGEGQEAGGQWAGPGGGATGTVFSM